MTDGAAPPATGETRAPRPRTLVTLAGTVAFVLYAALMTAIEGWPGEFGYAPFTPEPLPFSAMRGFTLEQLVGHVARLLLATPALLCIWWGVQPIASQARAPDDRSRRRLLYAAVGASLSLIAFVMLVILRGRVIVDDETTYRMQALLLSEGKLATADAAAGDVFTVRTRLGFTGKYLFGAPLVLAPGAVLGIPALMHLPVAAVTLFCLHRAVSLLADRVLADWATILLALSPMFILTTATGTSQPSALLSAVVAGLGYACAKKDRPWLGAALVGMAVGFGATVRLQAAVPVGAVTVTATAIELWRQRARGPLALLGAALAAWGALIGAYNYALTGSPLRLPWHLYQPIENFGFGRVWQSHEFSHTPLKSLANLLVVLVRLNAWWLGWPSSILLLWFWYRWGRPNSGARVWLWMGALVILFEAFYYSTGVSDTGPVYHYELLLPLGVLGANAITRGLSSEPRKASTLLAVHFVLGWTTFMWFETNRLDRLVHHIHAEAEEALAKVQPPALLFYERRCSESLQRGWVHERFPVRNRSERDPIITYPRPRWSALPAYLLRHKGRSCWYFRINPTTHKGELLHCAEALPLFERPVLLDERCLWNAPSAARLGLFTPWPYALKRDTSRDRQRGPDPRTGEPLGSKAGGPTP